LVGYYHDKKEVLDRLKRVEGQVRGLQRLVDQDTYCIDVLTQISAVNSALKKVAVKLLDDHISHCVAETVDGGGDPRAKVAEATAAIDRLLKS
jgi:CsoR family transcriptional regulator, copper-sensing transcriptional repressor